MSRGNAEQPSAQTPKGPGSPNRVETAVQGRPESGPQGRPEAGVQNGPQPGVQDRQQPGPQGNPQARNPQDGGKGDSKGAGPQGGGAQGGGPQGGNPQGRGPQGGSPQAGSPQGGSPQARVGGPQGRPQQPNAQPNAQQRSATPAADTRRKDARPAAARRGAVGSEASGRTGCWSRPGRLRTRSTRVPTGRAPAKSRLQRRVRAAQLLLVAAAGRKVPEPRFVHRSLAARDPLAPQVAARRSRSRRRISRRRISRHRQPSRPPAKTAGQGGQLRSPRPSLVPRLRVAQPVPARPLRARKPRARYPYGIRLRLHRPSSRSSLDWGLGRRPSRLRATRPLHPYSRHRRHRPQPLSRRAPSP